MASAEPLRICVPGRSTPDMRVCALKGTNSARIPLRSRPRRFVLFLGEDDDGAAFGRFICQRGELGGVGEALRADVRGGEEFRCLAIAEGDGAGFIEEQGVDVAGGFDRAAGHGEHVVLHEAIHAGDADSREQGADGGRDEADEQRDEDEDGLRRLRVDGERLQRGDGEQEDDGEAGEQDAEGDFVGVFWRLAPSTRAIMRSRKVSPGLEVMRT